MKLSRTDLLPALAIVAGGVIGASLSFSFLERSRSGDVPVAVPAVAPSGVPAGESIPFEVVSVPVEMRRLQWSPTEARIEFNRVEISPDGQGVAGEPLVYVDGVRVNNDAGDGTSVLNDFDPEDIESVEIVKAAAAIAQYGEEASAGVILISLKEGASFEPDGVR